MGRRFELIGLSSPFFQMSIYRTTESREIRKKKPMSYIIRKYICKRTKELIVKFEVVQYENIIILTTGHHPDMIY